MHYSEWRELAVWHWDRFYAATASNYITEDELQAQYDSGASPKDAAENIQHARDVASGSIVKP